MLNPRKAIKMEKATLEEKLKKNQENYELKVSSLRIACERFITYLENECLKNKEELKYAEILKYFKIMFSLQLKKSQMLSRTSRVLNKMSKELSKFKGNFSPKDSERYSKVFKYKREKVNEKSKYIKRSAIDDEKVYVYFTKIIPGILGGKAYKLKELEKVAEDAEKTSKENDSKTEYVVDKKVDFKKVEGYEKTLEKVSLGSEIKEIPQESFSGFDKLKGVSLSEKCKKIGARAFLGCKELVDINLGKVTEICANAFYNCIKLEKVDLSSIKSEKTIGENAFENCNKLKSVTLPENSNRREEIKAKGIKNKVLEQVGNPAAESITFTNDPDEIKK